VEESIQEDDPDEEIEDLTEEEELEVKRYIEKEFEPEKKEEKVEKPKAKVQKKSTMEVTADDIISHSGRPAPRQISYDRPRYNKPVTTYNKSKVENKKTEEEKKEEKTPIVKKPKKATTSANLVKKDEIVINSNISVKEFSEKM